MPVGYSYVAMKAAEAAGVALAEQLPNPAACKVRECGRSCVSQSLNESVAAAAAIPPDVSSAADKTLH